MSKFISPKDDNRNENLEVELGTEVLQESKKEWKQNHYKNKKNSNYKNKSKSNYHNNNNDSNNKSYKKKSYPTPTPANPTISTYQKNKSNYKKTEQPPINNNTVTVPKVGGTGVGREVNNTFIPSAYKKQNSNPNFKTRKFQNTEQRPPRTDFIKNSPTSKFPTNNTVRVPFQNRVGTIGKIEKFEKFEKAEEIVKIENTENIQKMEIIGVRFKPVGKIYFFSPNGIHFSNEDSAIVETIRGIELGRVVIPNRQEPISNIIQPLKAVFRKAEKDDLERARLNQLLSKEAIEIANEKIKIHNMKMKLIDAEYTFDNSKLLYYFTAEGRIDFRDLVKDLASIFKVRIELRQIGIRDQTKALGGLSVCGRPFCCNTFLPEFNQVTVKMAKDQGISMNSSKMSGACGRLMCCLKYEHETYEKEYETFPRVNSIVETAEGNGLVVESNILSGVIKVSMDVKNGEHKMIKIFGKSDIKIIGFLKTEDDHLDDIVDEP